MIDTIINNLLVFLAVLGGVLAYGIVFAAVKRSMTKKVNSPAPYPENPTEDFLAIMDHIDRELTNFDTYRDLQTFCYELAGMTITKDYVKFPVADTLLKETQEERNYLLEYLDDLHYLDHIVISELGE